MMNIFRILITLASLCHFVANAGKSKSKSKDKSGSNVYDYIIVGAGISGLSQMEFIDYNLPSATKLLIEQHDRVGGRAFSLNATYDNRTITFEHGAAMRHRWNIWFYKMVEYLGLCPNMVRMDTSTNTARRERFFRNIYKNNSIGPDSAYYPLVYNYRDDENLQSVGSRFAALRNEFYAENNNGQSPQNVSQMQDCLDNWTFRGNKLNAYNQYSFYKNVFEVSKEYIEQRKESQFPPFLDTAVDYCGYNTYFPWVPSGGRPSDVDSGQYTLEGGYNSVTQRLYEKLDENEYNEFIFGEQVVSVSYNSKKVGKDRPKYLITTRNFDDYTIIEEYYADNVVLAIPPMNLKKILANIDPFCEVRGDNGICYKIKDDIQDLVIDSKNEVEPGYKINLIYDNYYDWVREVNITDHIQSITDLDIRSFYIDSNWQNGDLFAIQFYSRVHQARQLNWLQKSAEDDTYEFDPDLEISHFGNTDVKYTPASKQLVSSVLKEMAELLDIEYNENTTLINKPLAAFSHSFGLNETGLDGIYIWNTNTVRSEVFNNILQPLDDETIYIISVDYSRAIADHAGAIYAAVQNTVENLNMVNPLDNVTYCATLPTASPTLAPVSP